MSLFARYGPADPFKVYISADMEGVAGIVDRSQVDPAGAEYALGRRLMTAEVNAAIEGAFAAGAAEVLVSDSHWNKRNLLWEWLDPRARIISGGGRTLGMMEGIDASFAAAIFLGYHTREGHPKGVLGHTWDHVKVAELELNGRIAGEGMLNAAIAGHFGVPVVLTTGDRWANEELAEVLGEVGMAHVKEGLNPLGADSLVPARAVQLIRERATAVLGNRERYRPFRLEAPVTLEVRFQEIAFADAAEQSHPAVTRVDPETVRYQGSDVIDVFGAFAGMFQ
ncbi:MAG: M55 family metallopeptidase [Gemmatimonadetes bacterium]|nr:M55 family metallopeptidase [Gemmatimonadota bacterium]